MPNGAKPSHTSHLVPNLTIIYVFRIFVKVLLKYFNLYHCNVLVLLVLVPYIPVYTYVLQ